MIYLGWSDFQPKIVPSFYSVLAEDLKAEHEAGSSTL